MYVYIYMSIYSGQNGLQGRMNIQFDMLPELTSVDLREFLLLLSFLLIDWKRFYRNTFHLLDHNPTLPSSEN